MLIHFTKVMMANVHKQRSNNQEKKSSTQLVCERQISLEKTSALDGCLVSSGPQSSILQLAE